MADKISYESEAGSTVEHPLGEDQGHNFSRKALVSYDHDPEERCWFDDCNCEDIPIADCDALVEENNTGVGRYACMADKQSCYNPKFFSSFMKKLTCQIDHYIQNICALWDMVECMREYLKKVGDMGTVHYQYTRNTSVSSASFYHPATDEYDLELYMDSTTGVVAGESDDQRRKMTDRKYRAYIRFCADATGMDAGVGSLMQFTLYTSNENFSEDMLNQRGLHWQLVGCSEGSMEMSDSIIIEEGQFLKLRVTPSGTNTGEFRVHNFRVEYTPVIDNRELPECLKDEEVVSTGNVPDKK